MKTSKLCFTGLCEGNSLVTGEFPAQRASYMENVSISWCHHVIHPTCVPIHLLWRIESLQLQVHHQAINPWGALHSIPKNDDKHIGFKISNSLIVYQDTAVAQLIWSGAKF